jgi:hypothetical protein
MASSINYSAEIGPAPSVFFADRLSWLEGTVISYDLTNGSAACYFLAGNICSNIESGCAGAWSATDFL